MKHLISMMIMVLALSTSGCNAGGQVDTTFSEQPSTAVTVPPTMSIDVSVTLTPDPTPAGIEIEDGPDILDPAYMYELYGDTAMLYYDPTRAIEQGQDLDRTSIEEEAVGICDKFFTRVAQSINDRSEMDLSSLYDLSMPVRVRDWTFNQAYLYSEVLSKEVLDSAIYTGSRYYFIWDQWDMKSDNGILVVNTKTEFTHVVRDVTIQYGGRDLDSFTNEFALTRVDGQLRIIRYRSYDFNYLSMQQHAIENPFLLDDLSLFREFIAELLL